MRAFFLVFLLTDVPFGVFTRYSLGTSSKP